MNKLIHRFKSEVQHMHKYLSTRHIGKRVQKNNLRHLTNLYTNSRNYINLLDLALPLPKKQKPQTITWPHQITKSMGNLKFIRMLRDAGP